jgi:transporter family-2 protein
MAGTIGRWKNEQNHRTGNIDKSTELALTWKKILMIARLGIFLLVALGGAGLTVQMAWNARLRTSTGSPVLATIISLAVSSLALALVWVSGATSRGTLPAFNSLPKWAWFGGVFAAYYLVASLIALPKLGAAAVFSLVIVGQMVAALILDSTGAFGVARVSLSGSRVFGTLLLIAGVVLLQRK